ncbi:abc transporter family protein [Stylonychia lemnae]|uniref:Abc transporter family protein n=1 Tax=Stylonychia lemnae TaxID=5949 RepID=A0A078AY07_STYLE|nr:abc transporter family protein [Stylonychia lemnae]|eukprot:CDW86996.1 abc transporter family protein [Stylonychia lemnae]
MPKGGGLNVCLPTLRTSAIPLLFANTCRFIMFQVVKEKELQIYKALCTLNVRASAYGLSFFIVQSVNCLYTALMITLPNIPIIQGISEIPLFFLANFLFGEAMILFSLAITNAFNDSKFSTQIGFLTLFLPIFMYIGILVFVFDQHQYILLFFSWLPHLPHQKLLQLYLRSYFEDSKKILEINHTIQFSVLLANIPFWFFVYILSKHLSQIHPYKFRYRICERFSRGKKKRRDYSNFNRKSVIQSEDNYTSTSRILEEALLMDDCINIQDLCKSYQGNKVLKDFSLKIQQNEIVCLLGNNGAGKTTLINLLVGLIKPDSGQATIYGYDLQNDIQQCRSNIRLCQQNDFLYQDLTPKEHINLVCEMRNIDKDQIDDIISQTLETVMLENEQDKPVKHLSGGMKRKLSLGMALIGEAKFIILDEPTSCLDYQSRIQVWKIIREIGIGRSILMTTQHIDEADQLGDKICIIKEGQVIHFDTPENLKKAHCYGFRLEIYPENQLYQKEFDIHKNSLAQMVQNIIPQSYLLIPQTKQKLTFMIPFNQHSFIAQVLEEILNSYPYFYPDISMNNLEDAYLHIYNGSLNEYLNDLIQIQHSDSEPIIENIRDTLTLNKNFRLQQRTTVAKTRIEKPQFLEKSAFHQIKLMIKLRFKLFLKSPRMWFYFFCLTLPRMCVDLCIYFNQLEKTVQDPQFMILVIRIQTLVFCLVSGIFLYVLGNDFQSQKRFLMRMMGLRPIPYYIGYYICDYIFFLVPNLIQILFCNAIRLNLYIDYQLMKISCTVAFGFIIIPVTYLIGFAFKEYDNAFRNSGLILYTLGFMMADAISSVTQTKFYEYEANEYDLKYILMIDPFVFYYWAQGFPVTNNLIKEGDHTKILLQFGFCFIQVVFGIILLMVVMYLDIKKMKTIQQLQNVRDTGLLDNSDSQRISKNLQSRGTLGRDTSPSNQNPTMKFIIETFRLSKVYRDQKIAVNRINFQLQKGSIIGILGPNGAGKTSLYSMLAVQQPRNQGHINLLGESIERFSNSRSGMNFGLVCQNNILWDNLTVDEHLRFVGNIKGFPKDYIDQQMEYIKQVLSLNEYSKRLSKYLSGGNKRKLCTAIAMIGAPQIYLLDEFSAALDPITRKRVFSYLKNLENSSVVIITQRIDDAEDICDNIAMMVEGRFRDFGTPAYLKQQHGKGYQLKIELYSRKHELEIDDIIKAKLPFCKKMELSQQDKIGMLSYNFDELIDYQNIRELGQKYKIVHLFKFITQMLEEKKIKDFTLSKSTLEEVFQHFAKSEPQCDTESQIYDDEDINLI